MAEERARLGTNAAWWLADHAEGKDDLEEGDPKVYVARAAEYVDALFSGSKAALRPLYDNLYDLARSIGDDIKISPGKTIVPIYRNHVIAQIKPSTRTRIDFGLALKDTPAKGRLIDTGGLAKKDRITHRIEITSVDDIDDVRGEVAAESVRDGCLIKKGLEPQRHKKGTKNALCVLSCLCGRKLSFSDSLTLRATRFQSSEHFIGWRIDVAIPLSNCRYRRTASSIQRRSSHQLRCDLFQRPFHRRILTEPRRERGHHVLRRGHRTPRLAIDPHVRRRPRRVQPLARSVAQLVRESHHPAGRLGDRRADHHLVVVAVRRAVAADDLRDHQDQSALLDLAIRKTGLAAEVRAADLEPDHVIRVMGDAPSGPSLCSGRACGSRSCAWACDHNRPADLLLMS